MAGDGKKGAFGFSGVDAAVTALVVLLGLFGVLTIVSSSQGGTDESAQLVLRQMRNFAIGIVVLISASRINFGFYRRYAGWVAALSLLPLFLLPFFGVRINGMCGWFDFGGMGLQPSELAKPGFLLALTATLVRLRRESLRFAAVAALAALWVLPIALQPDFGTAVVYLAAFAVLCFLGGVPLAYLGSAGVVAAGAAALFVWRHPYAWRRLAGFFDPGADPLGSGWHIRQLELAISRGHLFGSKLGNALWSNAYLPLPYNDSAFATLLETLGLTGAAVTAALFAALIWVPGRVALTCRMDSEARLFVMGATALLAFQTLIHISVNLGMLPPTGLTLPLVSYGGSSFVGCCLMLGMTLSALRRG